MKLDTFISTYTGKTVDTDGAYGGQCMDLMHKYIEQVLGLPLSVLAAPAAKDVYLNFGNMNGRDNFDRIANTPDGVPQKGDIVLWGTGIGPYGHVAIVISADVNTFTSFDQNWNGVQKCAVIAHNYNAVLGWLRPKNQSNITQSQPLTPTNSPTPPMTDKRPYWFDLINGVTFKTAWEKLTDSLVNQFVKDYPGQQKRSGEFDKVCRALGLSGDTNAMTASMLLAVAKEKYQGYDEQTVRKDERQKTISEVQRVVGKLNG